MVRPTDKADKIPNSLLELLKEEDFEKYLTQRLDSAPIEFPKGVTEAEEVTGITQQEAPQQAPRDRYTNRDNDPLGLGKAKNQAVLRGVFKHIKPTDRRIDPMELAMKYLRLREKINTPETGAALYDDLLAQGVFNLVPKTGG